MTSSHRPSSPSAVKMKWSVSTKKTTRAVVTTGIKKTTRGVVTTGTKKTTRAVVTTGNQRSKVPQQTEDIQSQDNSTNATDARVCKIKVKQMKSWRKLRKEEKEYIHRLIDSNIKSVCSKVRFRKHQEVRDALERLQHRLKMKFESVKVPNKRMSGIRQYGSIVEGMQKELDQLLIQQEEVERAIRQEERRIETLEDAELQQDEDDMNMSIQVPDNKLNLPAMVYK